mmetsp:Transcript_83888/g.264842  ORF Transcript_83888/g.264842 Transcript_83888/m.264842 type:complete len:462 (-) Transcript_83888:730-2115(-)
MRGPAVSHVQLGQQAVMEVHGVAGVDEGVLGRACPSGLHDLREAPTAVQEAEFRVDRYHLREARHPVDEESDHVVKLVHLAFHGAVAEVLRLPAAAGGVLPPVGVLALAVPLDAVRGTSRGRLPEAGADARVLVDAEGADPVAEAEAVCRAQLQPHPAQPIQGAELPQHVLEVVAHLQRVGRHSRYEVQKEVRPAVRDHSLRPDGLPAAPDGGHGLAPSQRRLVTRLRDNGLPDHVVCRGLFRIEGGHDAAVQQALGEVQQVLQAEAPPGQLLHLGGPLRVHAGGVGGRVQHLVVLLHRVGLVACFGRHEPAQCRDGGGIRAVPGVPRADVHHEAGQRFLQMREEAQGTAYRDVERRQGHRQHDHVALVLQVLQCPLRFRAGDGACRFCLSLQQVEGFLEVVPEQHRQRDEADVCHGVQDRPGKLVCRIAVVMQRKRRRHDCGKLRQVHEAESHQQRPHPV